MTKSYQWKQASKQTNQTKPKQTSKQPKGQSNGSSWEWWRRLRQCRIKSPMNKQGKKWNERWYSAFQKIQYCLPNGILKAWWTGFRRAGILFKCENRSLCNQGKWLSQKEKWVCLGDSKNISAQTHLQSLNTNKCSISSQNLKYITVVFLSSRHH